MKADRVHGHIGLERKRRSDILTMTDIEDVVIAPKVKHKRRTSNTETNWLN